SFLLAHCCSWNIHSSSSSTSYILSKFSKDTPNSSHSLLYIVPVMIHFYIVPFAWRIFPLRFVVHTLALLQNLFCLGLMLG
ncbi:36350_t:CDS:1, partial [Racocetra persica]